MTTGSERLPAVKGRDHLTLSIDYKLTGSGWAECTVADGDQSCTVTASYLSDAFGNLVLSAVAMLQWFNAVSFSFDEEPGEFRWLLWSRPNNSLELKILDGYDRDTNPARDDECKLLFSKMSTQVEFGDAVAKAGNTLLETHGEAGYFKRWVEYPFPTASFKQLVDLLKKHEHLMDRSTI
jgi:hypothetical protein